MRVLCVIDYLVQGGAQRQLVNIACGLQRRGHHVECFVYHRDDFFRPLLDAADIAVHSCQKRRRFSVQPVRELRRLLRSGRFDSILAFLETPCLYAELACVGLDDVRLIVSERSIVPDATITASKFLKTQFHRRADMVTTNSHAHTEWMATSFPWLKSRLITIYNGVDLEDFRPRVARAMNGSVKLLGVGRVAEEKNISGLIRAVARCRSTDALDVRVDWAGHMNDKKLSKALNDAIEAADIGDAWRWLGPRHDVADLMQHYDALVLPSLWEGLPNAVCEALASGLPVLASRVFDIPRLVEEGVTGFLFDPRNHEEMAGSIARLSGLDVAAQSEMGEAARAFAERELSKERCVGAYEAVLMGR
jgi:glycosyltransferase involved in cell wall biosynthesis